MSGKGPDLEVYSDFKHCSHFADAKFGYNDAPYHRPNSQALTKHDNYYKNYYKKPTNSKEG